MDTTVSIASRSAFHFFGLSKEEKSHYTTIFKKIYIELIMISDKSVENDLYCMLYTFELLVKPENPPEEDKFNTCSLKNSIFEDLPIQPAAFLKQLWHWAANRTALQVTQVTSTDAWLISDMRRLFRAVCTVAIQRSPAIMGVSNNIVQVVVVQLTLKYPVAFNESHSDKSVLCRLLGALDINRELLRMHIFEVPQGDEAVIIKHQEMEIKKCLRRWTCHGAYLAFSPPMKDPKPLIDMGYRMHTPRKSPDPVTEPLMQYLSKYVPFVLKDVLVSYNTISSVQLVLNEMAWRESWGEHPLLSYGFMIREIGELTQNYHGIAAASTFSFRQWLERVAEQPQDDWSATPYEEVQFLPRSIKREV